MSAPFRVFRPPHGDDCWVCRDEQNAEPIDEAESALRRGLVSAFLILVIVLAGLYLAGVAVRWWPHL